MASILNEDLMNTNLDIPEGEIKIEGVVDPVYADAINVHNKKKKETEKVLKDKKPELKKPFTGTKGATTIMPKTKELKKLKLSESAFKSVRKEMNDAPEAYSGIFRVLDNMEHIINYISELDDEELNYADMKQSYDILEDSLGEIEDYLYEIKEAERKNGVKEAVEAPVRTRKDWELIDKRNNKDIWSDIYNELVDMKDLETPHRQLKVGKRQRYKGSWEDANDVRVGASRDGGIVVKAEEQSQLDFAKEVAETYGVEWKVREHTSRYADAKFELFIYPDRPVTNESLDNVKVFGRKANKKDLKESANGEIYSKVARYFEYGAPSDTLDTICDIVERAIDNMDDGYEMDEAIGDALDNGLIYHKDNWAIKHYYEDSTLADETYESLYNDIYFIVDSLQGEKDVDEGLTKAERHNRMMNKIFQDKRDRDADMIKFIKANSDVSDEEIKKAQDDDKVGLLLKNKGLHDKYWAKNESLKKARKLNESTFRGVPNTEFIWHGNWADPEISTTQDGKTYVANYWEVEDGMWNYYNDEKEYANTKDDKYAQELKATYTFDGSDEDFEKFLINHADEVIGDIIELDTNN